MNRIYFILLFIFCNNTIFSLPQTGDVLFDFLRNEINYYYNNLKTDSVPVRYISFRVLEESSISIDSDMGSASINESNCRKFCPFISFGEQLDKKEFNPFDFSEEDWRDSQLKVVDFPMADDTIVIKNIIWNALGQMYRGTLSIWKKTPQLSILPLQHEQSIEQAEFHYEDPLPEIQFDKKKWEIVLNDVTKKIGLRIPEATCRATIECKNQRKYVVASDGTAVVYNNRTYMLNLCATVKDREGVECPISKDYFAFEELDMPNTDTLIAEMESLALRALALSNAPLAEVYNGPVILSGSASAVFFHELLGHRLERQDSELQQMKGTLIMPSDFNVTYNPGLCSFKGIPLSGYYPYDDEGVRAQKVECIKDGVMKEFLTCRSREHSSNGHGRSSIGQTIQPRQSNLIVETSNPYTEMQLRQMLVEELKRINKEYGYYISTVSNGWTVSGGERRVSSLNIVPIEIYKVYADGREDELVRGVSLIGTPLSILNKIKAGGGKSDIFNGSCGSKSGWLPVASVAPMLYVSEIETQVITSRKPTTISSTHHLLSALDTVTVNIDTLIFQAMKDEMKRCSELVENGSKPLFIDYHVRREATTNIISSMGSCLRYEPIAVKNKGLVHVIAGNRLQTSYSGRNMGKPFNLPDDISYYHICKELGERTEKQFSDATDWLERNKRDISDMCIPEWSEMPERTIISSSALIDWQKDAKYLKVLADTLSEVLGTYPEFSSSRVEIKLQYADNYRMTTEGLKTRMPLKEVSIITFAETPLTNGKVLKHIDGFVAYDVADLPTTDSIIAFVNRFAQLAVALNKAECPKEREYMGPVLYQKTATLWALFEDNSIIDNPWNYIHCWLKLSSRTYSNSYRLIGKQVINKNISLVQSAVDSIFNGHRLLQYQTYDADGVRPKTIELIRNGVLVNQLAGRVPSPNALNSTGNEYLSSKWRDDGSFPTNYKTGVLHIKAQKTMSQNKLKKQLIRIAKEQGLQYAYILKGQGFLSRVNTNSGKEELLQLMCYSNPSKLTLMGDVMVSKEVIANLGKSIIYPQSILLPMTDLKFKDFESYQACKRFEKLRH